MLTTNANNRLKQMLDKDIQKVPSMKTSDIKLGFQSLADQITKPKMAISTYTLPKASTYFKSIQPNLYLVQQF